MSATAVKTWKPSPQIRKQCPICESPQLEYEFVVEKVPVCSCKECGLLFLNPPPDDSHLDYVPSSPQPAPINDIYEANARERLEQLVEYSGNRTGQLLFIGTDAHMLAEAQRIGFEVFSFTDAQFESIPDSALPQQIDHCVLFCALERMSDPFTALERIRGILKSDGSLMIVSPAIDSPTAKMLGASWWEFNRKNLFYFSADTLQNLLLKAGFGDSIIAPDRSLVSLNYIKQKLSSTASARRRYRLLRTATSLTPIFRNKSFRLSHGRIIALARPKSTPSVPVLSVIVPVFNERATFVELVEQLIAKSIEGVQIDIIVVESNSTDGTRDLVLRYKTHPRIRIILEDKPRGKGFAVRTGLKEATGDIVVIQDADLEYDINDYDALIAPILKYQKNFVLGSRHGNSWKIRDFNDSNIAWIFNFGHIIFLTLFNVLYQQNLKDPFTMFKVFRRDCLYGLTFECNRFDFDNELVIKLLRKGYKPVELPVNYKSRSVKQGKKITLISDPITWIKAFLKYRNSPLYEKPSDRK